MYPSILKMNTSNQDERKTQEKLSAEKRSKTEARLIELREMRSPTSTKATSSLAGFPFSFFGAVLHSMNGQPGRHIFESLLEIDESLYYQDVSVVCG